MTIWKKRWWPEGEPSRDDLDDFISDLAFSYYGESADKDPESGLGIRLESGTVYITQWDLTEPPDDEAYMEDWEENPVLKVSAAIDLEPLLDPKAKHRGSYSRDEPSVTVRDLIRMSREEIWETIQGAAIAYLAYYGGDEEWVSEIGE